MRLTADLAAYPTAVLPTSLSRMRLTEQDIKEFRTIWKEEFGEEIPVALAREHANELLDLYRLLLGDPPGEA